MDRTETQSAFDETFRNLGMGGAPQPLHEESDGQYRRRLLRLLQPLGSTFANVTLGALPTAELAPIEKVIIDEALAASRDQSRGDWSDPTRLREMRRDSASHIIEYGGSPLTWMSHFMHPARALRRMTDGRGRTITPNRSTVR